MHIAQADLELERRHVIYPGSDVIPRAAGINAVPLTAMPRISLG